MEQPTTSRRVILKGAAARPAGWWLPRALWAVGALAGYASVIFVGWPLVEGRALRLNATAGLGDPTTPALLQTVLGFATFGLVALVAIALCWRRRGAARVGVLLSPLLMLAVPEVARLLPGPWIWMLCTVAGVAGVVMIAGPDEASRREFKGRKPPRSRR